MGQHLVARERRPDRPQPLLGRRWPARLAVLCCSFSLLAALPAYAAVYQWKDRHGKLHFSDTPPASVPATDLSQQYAPHQAFKIEIRTVDYKMHADFRDRLSSAVEKIFTIYQDALGIAYPTDNVFRILLYGDRQRFERHKQAEAPMLENPAAFYNPATHQITSMTFPNERQMLALITHECSHAVSSRDNRMLPIWLNEGLAEYFSQLHVYGLAAEVRINSHWLNTLGYWQRHSPEHYLRDHLSFTPAQWYASNGPSNQAYATAATLVFFMMGSADGRALLRSLIDQGERASLFVPTHSVTQINQHWSGGFPQFAKDWQTWLRQAHGHTHRY